VAVRRVSEIYLEGLRYQSDWHAFPAWISCRIENERNGPLGRPLPRGWLHLSQKDLLLTETPVPVEDTPVGERVEFSLREDPRLEVEARLVDTREETGWELFRRSPGPMSRAMLNALFASDSDAEEEFPQTRERWSVELRIHNGLPTTQQPEIRLYQEPGWTMLSCSEPTEPMDSARTLLNPRLAPNEARTIHLTLLKP
jgi:hypothetical protein